MAVSPRIPLLIAAALLATALEASPQDFRTAVGYGGGGVVITALNAGGEGGARELRFDPGWIVAGELEHRVGSGWLGLRLHGAYTQRPFALADRTLAINTWFADAGVVLRPFGPGRARGVAPFVSLGAGVVRYAFGRGAAVDIGEGNARYDGENERQWAAVAGLGLDIGPAFEIQETPLGLRVEAADHVALRSPFDPLAGREFSPIHNVRLTISLVSMIGQVTGPP